MGSVIFRASETGGSTPGQRGPRLWRLTPDDDLSAGSLLARAFRDAPLFVRVLPDAATRARFSSALFPCAIRYGCRLGEAWAVGPAPGQMAGVAFWIGRPEPEWTPEMRHEFSFTAQEAEWGELLYRPHQLLQPVNDAIAEAMPDRWRYLDMIGVDPAWQGRGFGGALLRQVLADAREAGLPVGLITDNPASVPFYLHHDFALVWQGPSADGALPLWAFGVGERR